MTAQTVINAINALYTSNDSSLRNQADIWLEDWQASPEAWTVANAILHDPSSGAEYTYFCAQTLKTKVRLSSSATPKTLSAVTRQQCDQWSH
jgi:transportin-3